MPKTQLPLLGCCSSHLPTTREIADSVARHGVGGLPSPIQLGGDRTYQEIQCKSALNRTRGMPSQWTLNPYRGCTHGCHYCFARKYQTQLELGSGDDFSKVILIKANFPSVLNQELSKISRKTRTDQTHQLVTIGTATDPYQPIEGRYQLTRQTLKTLLNHPTPIHLITKGPMVVRDKDVIFELSKRTEVSVCMSVPSVDEEGWKKLEPGTAHPLQRLRAVRALRDAGIDAGVLMAPIVPGITSHPIKIERTIQAISDHGANYVGGAVMHLEGGTRKHFMNFLKKEFPHLVEGYGRLYAGKYATGVYQQQVKNILKALRERSG